jgi:hypothetical protein
MIRDGAPRLLGAAEIPRERGATAMPPFERAEYDRLVRQLRESIDPAVLAGEWTAARSMSMEEAIRLAVEAAT